MYKIKVEYSTGNSFQTYDTSSTLELEWNSLEMAVENLNRIKDHILWYKSKNNWPYEEGTRPIWHTFDDHIIEFLTDDKVPVQMAAFWIGYFEHLTGAEIIVNWPKFEV